MKNFVTSSPAWGVESGDESHSSELWDRWSMQSAPPDLFVTNYSMLNIMMMREVECPIFCADASMARIR